MNRKSGRQKLLIVDDVASNIRVLAETFLSDYDVSVATNGYEALEIANSKNPPDLILLDIMMPGMDGYEVCRRLKSEKNTQNIPVIFITARTQEDDETRGLGLEAVDYITKPFGVNIVKARVKTHLELKRHRDNLDELVKSRTAQLSKAYEKLQNSSAQLKRVLEQTVNALKLSVEIKDPYTYGHQERVKELACAIAEKQGFLSEEIDGLRIASMLHDIGKLAVPSEILSKPGKLTRPEMRLLEEHPQKGYEILKGIEFSRPVAEIVLQHHEKNDGSGYPNSLPEKFILPEAKILTVADIVEAMSAHRPYRPSLGIDFALEHIEKSKGILFDPDVVDACRSLFLDDEFKFEKQG